MNAPATASPGQHLTVREGSVVLGILSPGLLLGGVLVLPLAKRRRTLLAIGLCGAVIASILLRAGWLAPGWELVLLIASMGLAHFQSAGSHGILGALLVECLFGPLWMCGLSYGLGSMPFSSALPMGWRRAFRVIPMDHPRGAVRLGIDMDKPRAVDIPLDKLPQGTVLIGTTGAGKTWTICRILDGVIANGGSALVLDGKGPSLAADIQSLGEARSVPVYPIDPDDPSTFSYDPLQGSPASVMNKLIGALVGEVSGD
ncbi:MAG: type IV secretory system conjugative DNA transfer family protein, partial [Acidobacteriota bacterium]|nr:type IV secretory system conjugative DNA transfer family protein [Acidobacteriota bacterium]